jgi:hypothetical protein
MDDEYYMTEDDWEDWEDDDEGEDEFDLVELGDAFRDVLDAEYVGLSPEDTDMALLEIFDTLSPAESFSFGKALSSLGKGSLAAVKSPTFQQLAGSSLPVVGMAVGGPVGGTIAGAAGQALLGTPAATPPPPPPATAAVAQKALVASQLPMVQQAILANAMGQVANQKVGGFSVDDILRMYGALMQKSVPPAAEGEDDPDALYEVLVGLEDEDLYDAAGPF